jgi:hypothetical protein
MNESSKPRRSSRQTQSRALIALAALATLVAVFYLEEDWRGKRAWDHCKVELEAQGMVLDWDKYIPPPVPDDQNFYTASTNILIRFHKAQTPEQSDAATHLQWLRLPPYGSNSFPALDAKSPPIVVAHLVVSSSALPVPASGANVLSVALNDPAAPAQVRNFIQTTMGGSLNGATGVKFSERQLNLLAPAWITLRTQAAPSLTDLQKLIPADLPTNLGRLQVVADSGGAAVQLLLTGTQLTSAADYLQWSDQFVPAFEEIREALKRPYAILPGDYSLPYEMPIPNFVTLRSLVQTLAQRAQCDLLLGRPAEALREVTLMHEVCRILQKPPRGKPITLVESMINVAISGVYVNTIADGLRTHTWQEPQLAALQEQLTGINLPPWVAEAFKEQLPSDIGLFEKTSAAKVADLWGTLNQTLSFWQRLRKPIYLYLALAPTGWRYQNYVNMTRLLKLDDSFDLTHDTIIPHVSDQVTANFDTFFAHPSPYKTLAGLSIPNFNKAIQVTAQNQTLVNEAEVACALERYRLAQGGYPETLEALAPQYIAQLPHDLIGGQPLHYRRATGGTFLLYSIGWNETDDGGQVSPDRTKGDWVWQ